MIEFEVRSFNSEAEVAFRERTYRMSVHEREGSNLESRYFFDDDLPSYSPPCFGH